MNEPESQPIVPFVSLKRELLRDVIEKDQLVAGKLVETYWTTEESGAATRHVCVNPGHCAVGALLYAAGMSNEDIAQLSSSPEDFEYPTLRLLYETYGTNLVALNSLTEANDSVADPPVWVTRPDHVLACRQERVLEMVDSLRDGDFVIPEDAFVDWDDDR